MGKSLEFLLFKLGRWTAGEHHIDRPLRPLSLHLPSSFSLASLTTSCLAFTTPLTSTPIVDYPPQSLQILVEVTNLQEGGGGAASAVYLSNNHHHGVENRDMGGGKGLEAAGGYGTGMVGGMGGWSKHSDDFPCVSFIWTNEKGERQRIK